MKEPCKHAFIGKTDGVHCTKCGVSMTTGGIQGLPGPAANAKEKGGPQKEKDGGGNRR